MKQEGVFVLEGKQKEHAQKIYLLLGALFITSLVVSNLIFQKFFSWQPFGDISLFGVPLFQVSVGILPYLFRNFSLGNPLEILAFLACLCFRFP